MNYAFLIAVGPLAIAGVVYAIAALGFQFVLSRPGMAVAMLSYAVSCGGLIYDALTVGGK